MNLCRFLILAFLAAGSAQAAMPRHPRPVAVEGEVLVRYRDVLAATNAKSQREMQGMVVKQQLGDGRTQLLRLPSMMPVTSALDLLRSDPDVELAEPNFLRYRRAVTPDDLRFGEQWGLHVTTPPQRNFLSTDPALASVPGGDLNMDQAWDANDNGIIDAGDRTGDPSVVIAIVDDAFDIAHQDLAVNMIAGRDTADGDDNVRPDIADQAHGTSVAGAAGAIGNNGIGVAGASWNSRLMPLKISRAGDRDGVPTAVLDSAAAAAAFDFAATNGAQVVNASFGGPTFSQVEFDAIQRMRDAGVLLVAAAGNDDSNTDRGRLSYPANYDLDNVISVAATNRQDNIASFSQHGPMTVDVAAPGLQIVTTAPGNTYTTNPGISGTSFSAPYVAGIAGLIRSHVLPVPTFRDIRGRLVESGSSVTGANSKRRTAGGRVDADRALELTPGPSLVIQSVGIAGNGVLDPGETVNLSFAVKNQWLNATNVVARLTADGGVTVNPASIAVASLPSQQTQSLTFSVTVPANVAGHRYVNFTLALSADGGYAVQRPYIDEIGRLTDGATVSQAFAARDVDLYDEFHAWHIEVTQPGRTLTIQTTSPADPERAGGTLDIDLLVKRDAPPAYSITVGINPEEDDGFFCTSATTENCQDPAVFVSAGPNGSEVVSIPNAPLGTYHVVVVNFAQLDAGMTYTIKATTTPPAPPGGSGGGGGGALGLLLSLPLLALAALRRRRRP